MKNIHEQLVYLLNNYFNHGIDLDSVANLVGYYVDDKPFIRIMDEFSKQYNNKLFWPKKTLIHEFANRLCELKTAKKGLIGSYVYLEGKNIDTTKEENLSEVEFIIASTIADNHNIITRRNDLVFFLKYQRKLKMPVFTYAQRIHTYYSFRTYLIVCYSSDVCKLFD